MNTKAMKRYDLCGLGNGIVDVLINISEEEFASLNLEKGGMVLVDDQVQTALLQRFDHYQPALVSGGSVANSTILLAQLGGNGAFLTSLGNDKYGQHYQNEFKELGISLGDVQAGSGNTGTCVVMITPDAERTMRTNLGCSAEISPENISKDLIGQSKWLLIEGYVIANSEESREAIKVAVDYAKSGECKVAVSFSDLFIVEGFRQELNKLVESVDLIFANETEACSFAGGGNAEEALELLAGQRKNAVITAGSKGAYITYEGEKVFSPAVSCRPVDLTGAGDAFAGTFIYGLCQGWGPEKAAKSANILAEQVIIQVGARLTGDVKEAL